MPMHACAVKCKHRNETGKDKTVLQGLVNVPFWGGHHLSMVMGEMFKSPPMGPQTTAVKRGVQILGGSSQFWGLQASQHFFLPGTSWRWVLVWKPFAEKYFN